MEAKKYTLVRGRVVWDDLTEKAQLDEISEEDRQTMHKLFGYTEEVIRTVIVPMAENGQEMADFWPLSKLCF